MLQLLSKFRNEIYPQFHTLGLLETIQVMLSATLIIKVSTKVNLNINIDFKSQWLCVHMLSKIDKKNNLR